MFYCIYVCVCYTDGPQHTLPQNQLHTKSTACNLGTNISCHTLCWDLGGTAPCATWTPWIPMKQHPWIDHGQMSNGLISQLGMNSANGLVKMNYAQEPSTWGVGHLVTGKVVEILSWWHKGLWPTGKECHGRWCGSEACQDPKLSIDSWWSAMIIHDLSTIRARLRAGSPS